MVLWCRPKVQSPRAEPQLDVTKAEGAGAFGGCRVFPWTAQEEETDVEEVGQASLANVARVGRRSLSRVEDCHGDRFDPVGWRILLLPLAHETRQTGVRATVG